MSWDVSWRYLPATLKRRKKIRFSINHHDLRCFLKGSCHHCHFTPWNCFVAMFALWKKFIKDPIHRASAPPLTLVDFRIEREKLLLCSFSWKKRWCLFSISFYYFLSFSKVFLLFRGDVCVFYHSERSLKTQFGEWCLSIFAKPWKHLRLPCSKPWFNDIPVMFELCIVAICHCTQPIWLVRSRSFQIIQRYQSLFQ